MYSWLSFWKTISFEDNGKNNIDNNNINNNSNNNNNNNNSKFDDQII